MGMSTDIDYFARVYEAMNLFIGIINIIIIAYYNQVEH